MDNYARPRRWPALDGLRAVAILLVMGTHGMGPVSEKVAHRLNGWAGVDIFFIISGFLITSLLLGEAAQQGRIGFRRFYMRRILRIVPAFAVVLGVLLAWYAPRIGFGPALKAVAASALYLSDFDQALNWGVGDPVPETASHWSLAVEEQFYLLWPLLLVAAGRRIIVVAAVLIGGTVAWRAVLISAGAGHAHIYHSFDTRLDSLMVGCLAALLWASPVRVRIRWILGGRWSATLLVAALFASSLMLTTRQGMTPDLYNLPRATGWLLNLPVHLLLVGALVLCLMANPTSWAARLLSSPPMVFVGKLSYSLYLWDKFALNRVHDLLPGLEALHLPGGRAGTMLLGEILAFGLSFLLAWASYKVVEVPFLRMKKRWEPQLERTATAPLGSTEFLRPARPPESSGSRLVPASHMPAASTTFPLRSFDRGSLQGVDGAAHRLSVNRRCSNET